MPLTPHPVCWLLRLFPGYLCFLWFCDQCKQRNLRIVSFFYAECRGGLDRWAPKHVLQPWLPAGMAQSFLWIFCFVFADGPQNHVQVRQILCRQDTYRHLVLVCSVCVCVCVCVQISTFVFIWWINVVCGRYCCFFVRWGLTM